MSLSFTHKYSFAEAMEGAKCVYVELTGTASPAADLALGLCAAIDYGVGMVLPGNSGMSAVDISGMSADECKAKACELLAPHMLGNSSSGNQLGPIDWKTLAALFIKLLPILVPLIP